MVAQFRHVFCSFIGSYAAGSAIGQTAGDIAQIALIFEGGLGLAGEVSNAEKAVVVSVNVSKTADRASEIAKIENVLRAEGEVVAEKVADLVIK